MRFRVFLQRAAISAGAVILAIGLAVAQTAPTPAPTPAPAPAPTAPNPPSATPGGDSGRGDWRAARDACRTQVDSAVRGQERREAMRKCVAEKRGAGPQLTEAERGRNREMRGSDRKAMKETRDTCREGLKNQRLTEDERRTGIEDCVAKSNPRYAKALACRREADSKSLEKRSSPYRDFMRSCIRGA